MTVLPVWRTGYGLGEVTMAVGFLVMTWFSTELWQNLFASPALLPSCLDPRASMTAFNSVSSPLTLKIMLGVVLCFLPVVIGFQIWVYRTFRDTLTSETIQEGSSY